MNKASIIKAKIKKQKRQKRFDNIVYRYHYLVNKVKKINISLITSFLRMKVKGKKLKKLKSVCKNWKVKQLIWFFRSKKGGV